MKLGFALPIVGSALSSAAGLSAFCRGLEDVATTRCGSAIAWSRRPGDRSMERGGPVYVSYGREAS